MKLTIRALFLVACLAFVMSVSAQAATILGTVWTTGPGNGQPVTTTPSGVGINFVVDGIGFNEPALGTNTIQAFLTSQGHLTAGGPIAGGLQNTTFRFTGFVDLPPGTYHILHDDGIILFFERSTKNCGE